MNGGNHWIRLILDFWKRRNPVNRPCRRKETSRQGWPRLSLDSLESRLAPAFGITHLWDDFGLTQGPVLSGMTTDDTNLVARVNLQDSTAQKGGLIQFFQQELPLGSQHPLQSKDLESGFVEIPLPLMSNGQQKVHARLWDASGQLLEKSTSFSFVVNTDSPTPFLHGTVFHDANRNGQRDPSESGLAKARVRLFSAEGDSLLAETLTTHSGLYLFDQSRLLQGAKALIAGGTYRIEYTPPEGFGAATHTAQPGFHNILGSDKQSFLVKTLDTGKEPLKVRAESGHKSSLHFEYTVDGSKRNGPFGQTALTISGADLGEPRKISGFAIDAQMWPGPSQPADVLPSAVGFDSQWGSRPQEIAYLQNRWGNSSLPPHEGAGVQMAILELLFDQDTDLEKGRFQVHGAGPKTNPVDANAAVTAAKKYLAQAAGQFESAVVLDAGLGGQRINPPGGQGHLISQGFHFGAVALPRFTSPATASFVYGNEVDFALKATGAPTFSAVNLPGTLDLSPSGRLTGWAHAGSHTFTVEATIPGLPSTQQEFTLVIQPRTIRHTVDNRTKTFGDSLDLNPLKADPRNQAGSAFLTDVVALNGLRTRFDFIPQSYTRTIGDGFTFTIQGSGPTALGSHGSGLGYQGIQKSVAIKLDLVNNHGEGTHALGLVVNGVNPSRKGNGDLILENSGVSIQSGKRISLEIAYESNRLEVTIIDSVTGINETKTFDVDIPSIIGGPAGFIGFTAGTGTLAGRFEIVSWEARNATGKLIDFTTGIPSSTREIQVNGTAQIRDHAILLTGVNHALEIPTGIKGETLLVRYSSLGLAQGADAGIYSIQASAHDGKGRSSNYQFDFTPGKLTVLPRPVTIKLPDQTQKYGQPINLNSFSPTHSSNQAGSAFLTSPVDLSQGFTTEFAFQMSPSSPGPGKAPTQLGDGITFTIQRRGPGALGKPAEGLGYQGIAQSVSIKFDNFDNKGEGANSTGLFVGGSNPANPGSSVDLIPSGIDFAHPHPTRVAIDYKARSHELFVTISQTRESPTGPQILSATQRYSIDLTKALGGNQAYFGFTGGTGTLVSRQEVIGWKLGTTELPGKYLDHSKGFVTADGIRFNGSARWEKSHMVLTGSLNNSTFPVGIGGETIGVAQTSAGNTHRAQVGAYTITGSALDGTGKASNYRVTIQSGSLRVESADLIIRARDIHAIYGSYKLNETRDFQATGLAPGDTIGSVRFYTNAKFSAGGHYQVGGWHVTPFRPSGGSFRESNYKIQFEKGWMNIQRKTLTIQAPDRSKTYGDTIRWTGKEFRQTGLEKGDRIDKVTFSATGDKASADVGKYTIGVAKPEGLGLENYEVKLLDGTLTVIPKTIEYGIPQFQQTRGRPVALNSIAPDPYNQAGTAWRREKVDITHFQTRFTFKAKELDKVLADGFTFTIQNQGPTALGRRAGELGYGGIGQSVAIKFDLFGNSGEGDNSTGLFSDGRNPSTATGSINLNGTGIDLKSQSEFTVDLNYNGSILKVDITDLTSGKSATQNYSVDLPKLVGGTRAWVGFTGGTGGLVAHQAIQKWSFRNRQQPVFDFAKGAWRESELNLAGSARIVGGDLILTGAQYGTILRTGVGEENLRVWLESPGNHANASQGTYSIHGVASDGTGKTSNYLIKIRPGKLIVI